MRAIVMLMVLSIAVPCYADDPLETLNTVDDTLRIMERSLEAQAWRGADDKGVAVIAGKDAGRKGSSLDRELVPAADEAVGAEGSALAKPTGAGDMVLVPGPDPDNCALSVEDAGSETK